MLPKAKSFSYQGVKTSFFEFGAGETVVFLPGWGATTKTYLRFLTILSARFHVYSLELPGLSNTASPDHVWNFTEYADFVSAFLEAIPEKAVIISGHSFGAAIALHAAAKQKKIKKMALFDAAGLPIEYNQFKFFSIYIKELIIDLLTPRHFFASVRALKIYFENMRNLVYKFRLALAVFNRKIGTSEEIFSRITAPALIFWGDQDFVFTKEAAGKLKTKLHGEKIIWVEGSHNWIVFEPEQIKQYLDLI